MEILRTNSENHDFINLVKYLDAELKDRDGEEDHSFYHQFNKIDNIKYAVVLYKQKIAVACGALKTFNEKTMEVKRMYTLPNYRGKGIASIVLKELEKWAVELSYERCVLETGLKQPEAIKLYKKNNYSITPNYGQYVGIENSRCFEKQL